MTDPEILIAGAGPAGLTAGIYAARSGHSTLILEKTVPGGQVASTPEIENYPGFAEPVGALELAQAMEQQARRFGCEIEILEASRLVVKDGSIEVRTSGPTLRPGALVIATGVQPRELGLARERELRGRGVSYCALCDGPLFRNKEVAVVGGGDSALDEALYLSGICSTVYLIHRRDEFRACALAQDRLRRRHNVRFVLSSVVTAINGQAKVESLQIENRKDGTKSELTVSGLFIYVGSVPNTDWCANAVTLDESSFVKTDERLGTSAAGVFAAGDVRVSPLRQIATAVGDGALAAMSAHHYLSHK